MKSTSPQAPGPTHNPPPPGRPHSPLECCLRLTSFSHTNLLFLQPLWTSFVPVPRHLSSAVMAPSKQSTIFIAFSPIRTRFAALSGDHAKQQSATCAWHSYQLLPLVSFGMCTAIVLTLRDLTTGCLPNTDSQEGKYNRHQECEEKGCCLHIQLS